MAAKPLRIDCLENGHGICCHSTLSDNCQQILRRVVMLQRFNGPNLHGAYKQQETPVALDAFAEIARHSALKLQVQQWWSDKISTAVCVMLPCLSTLAVGQTFYITTSPH